MDSSTFVIVINEHFLREYKLDRTEAVLKAVDEFTKYNQQFEDDYRNASEEEKKMYVADIDDFLATAGDITTIRVFEK